MSPTILRRKNPKKFRLKSLADHGKFNFSQVLLKKFLIQYFKLLKGKKIFIDSMRH